jgi:hypothetical protein
VRPCAKSLHSLNPAASRPRNVRVTQASDGLTSGATLRAPVRREFSNFDNIELAAASAVIFSHSFLIADGATGFELLQEYSEAWVLSRCTLDVGPAAMQRQRP